MTSWPHWNSSRTKRITQPVKLPPISQPHYIKSSIHPKDIFHAFLSLHHSSPFSLSLLPFLESNSCYRHVFMSFISILCIKYHSNHSLFFGSSLISRILFESSCTINFFRCRLLKVFFSSVLVLAFLMALIHSPIFYLCSLLFHFSLIFHFFFRQPKAIFTFYSVRILVFDTSSHILFSSLKLFWHNL